MKIILLYSKVLGTVRTDLTHTEQPPGQEEFVLEDCYHRNNTYVIKRSTTEEEVYRVAFNDEGKLLTLRQRLAHVLTAYLCESTSVQYFHHLISLRSERGWNTVFLEMMLVFTRHFVSVKPLPSGRKISSV